MNAIILCGGIGKKMWPYSRYRNKGMIQIGTKPILEHSVSSLIKNDVKDIHIIATHHASQIKQFFRNNSFVQVHQLEHSNGSADTLNQVQELIQENTLVLYGDCFITEEDITNFINNPQRILLSSLHQDSTLQICAQVNQDLTLSKFWGHPRGDFHYFAAMFKVSQTIIPYLDTPLIFNETKVGNGSPEEAFLENAINISIQDGHQYQCLLSSYQIYDIDKPWHILEANHFCNVHQSQKQSSYIGENTSISPSAKIAHHTYIGKNCYIGDNVVIGEGCIIEDNTCIDHGAIIDNYVHIGFECNIHNYCHIGSHSSIGNQCIVGHTSEIIEAVLFDKVYLYHYGEYYGVLGSHCDLGAGTTCGTLRFDNGKTMHTICGCKEIPQEYSNACYIGDYSRTGVGAILLPGCKIGSKSVVGSGVILNEDLEDNMLIYPKQELCKKPWGDDKYGW